VILGRDRTDFEPTVVIVVEDVRLLGEQIDDPLELLLATDRKLDRTDRLAERGAGGLQRPVEIGVLSVHLVDEDHARQRTLLGKPPGLLGADFDPGRSVDNDDRGIGDPQRRRHFPQEIGVTRCVEQIDLRLPPLDRRDRGADGNMALDLVRIEIGDRVPVFDPTQAVDRLGVEQQRFGQGGLAGSTVGEKTDVPDPVRGVLLHRFRLLVSRSTLRRSPGANTSCKRSGSCNGATSRALATVRGRGRRRFPVGPAPRSTTGGCGEPPPERADEPVPAVGERGARIISSFEFGARSSSASVEQGRGHWTAMT
jgi:hypothetical protein